MTKLHHTLRPVAALAVLVVLAGCTNVPELDERVTGDLRSADYPELVPLETTVPRDVLPQDEAADIEAQMNRRRDGLQSRAKALNTPVIEDPEKKRMKDGVQS